VALDTPDELEAKIREFANEFLPEREWSEKELQRHTSSIIKRAGMASKGQTKPHKGYHRDPRYRTASKTLVFRLEITNEEEQLLKTIKSKK